MVLNSLDLQGMTTSELYRTRSWCFAALNGQIPIQGISIIDDFESTLENVDTELTRRIYSAP